jgi:hypothetical protein
MLSVVCTLRYTRLFLRVSGGDHDIEGSHGTSTSGSSDTVGEDLVTDLLEVGVGEDEANVACGCQCLHFEVNRWMYAPLT